MKKLYSISLITALLFMVGCQEEKKESAAEMDPNAAKILMPILANPGHILFMAFPPVGIMIWSQMYHDQYGRFPESKEQLKGYIDAHPMMGPPVIWDNVEELSFGPPDSDKLSMKGTWLLENKNGQIERKPFSSPLLSEPNNISPEMKIAIDKMLKKATW